MRMLAPAPAARLLQQWKKEATVCAKQRLPCLLIHHAVLTIAFEVSL
jgi:hypothetical protein